VVDKPVIDEPVADRDAEAPPRSLWKLSLKIGLVSAVALVLALLAWATLSAARGSGFTAKIAEGKSPAAPAFDLEVVWNKRSSWPAAAKPALADSRLSLEELRGHPVVLNFWASWCIPCRDEAPIFNASARAHAGEVVFVGVNVQDFRSEALGFLREFDPPYVSIRDGDNNTFDDYGLTGVPETYYLDAKGNAVAHSPGAVARRTLEQGINQITGGAGS
jgi:cytochrome c biogenesis protein CcmG/thiol:disulfide interchange protein DsbE